MFCCRNPERYLLCEFLMKSTFLSEKSSSGASVHGTGSQMWSAGSPAGKLSLVSNKRWRPCVYVSASVVHVHGSRTILRAFDPVRARARARRALPLPSRRTQCVRNSAHTTSTIRVQRNIVQSHQLATSAYVRKCTYIAFAGSTRRIRAHMLVILVRLLTGRTRRCSQ